MAERLDSLEEVRSKNPNLGRFLERVSEFIVAYHGLGGTFAVYMPPRQPALDLLRPSPFICTMLEHAALVQMDEGMSWDDDTADAVAEALADQVIQAKRLATGNLGVSDEDVDAALEQRSRLYVTETLEKLNGRLSRFARLRELNAPDAILDNEVIGAHVLWRAIVLLPEMTEPVWPDGFEEIARELGLTIEGSAYRAKSSDKLERIVEALEDVARIRKGTFHASYEGTTLVYAKALWKSIANTQEAHVYPWPRHVVDIARDIGIDVRVITPVGNGGS